MGKHENDVETYLHEQVTKLGGTTRKYTSPSRTGVADRLCFLPGGMLFLIEVKSDTGTESTPQTRERKRMQGLGFDCRVAYGKAGVKMILPELIAACNRNLT